MTFISLCVTGCGTLRNGRGWGQDAIIPINIKEIPGAALGNFLSATVHDAFLNLPKDKRYGFRIFPTRSGVMTELYFALQPSAICQSSVIYRSSMANERSD